MDFDQLKVIWDEQRAEKLYAFDQKIFNQQIENRCGETRRRINFRDWALMGIFLLTGMALLIQPIASGHGYHKLFGGCVFLGLTVYIFLRRQKRRALEGRFDRSLAGLLAEAVDRQRDQIHFSKSMIFWVGIPYLLFASVNHFALRHDQSLWWLASAMLPPLLMYVVIQLGLRRSDIPKLKELESLQRKFSEG